MRPALPLAIALACSAQGCRRSSDPVPVTENTSALGDVVSLELTGHKLSRHGLTQQYQIANLSKGDVYFVCPEADCGDPDQVLRLPFYELNEGSRLSIYSYFAHMPRLELADQTRYEYAVRKIEASGVYHGTIELKAPLESNPPYPYSAYHPCPIDGIMIDRVRLTLGVLPCPGADLRPDEDGPPGGILRLYERKRIQCGSSMGEAKDFQKLIAAEASIAFTGCWPNAPRAAGVPGGCEGEDDAGR